MKLLENYHKQPKSYYDDIIKGKHEMNINPKSRPENLENAKKEIGYYGENGMIRLSPNGDDLQVYEHEEKIYVLDPDNQKPILLVWG